MALYVFSTFIDYKINFLITLTSLFGIEYFKWCLSSYQFRQSQKIINIFLLNIFFCCLVWRWNQKNPSTFAIFIGIIWNRASHVDCDE